MYFRTLDLAHVLPIIDDSHLIKSKLDLDTLYEFGGKCLTSKPNSRHYAKSDKSATMQNFVFTPMQSSFDRTISTKRENMDTRRLT